MVKPYLLRFVPGACVFNGFIYLVDVLMEFELGTFEHCELLRTHIV